MQVETNYFTSFGVDDLLPLILEELPHRQLEKCKLVCKDWLHLANQVNILRKDAFLAIIQENKVRFLPKKELELFSKCMEDKISYCCKKKPWDFISTIADRPEMVNRIIFVNRREQNSVYDSRKTVEMAKTWDCFLKAFAYETMKDYSSAICQYYNLSGADNWEEPHLKLNFMKKMLSLADSVADPFAKINALELIDKRDLKKNMKAVGVESPHSDFAGLILQQKMYVRECFDAQLSSFRNVFEKKTCYLCAEWDVCREFYRVFEKKFYTDLQKMGFKVNSRNFDFIPKYNEIADRESLLNLLNQAKKADFVFVINTPHKEFEIDCGKRSKGELHCSNFHYYEYKFIMRREESIETRNRTILIDLKGDLADTKLRNLSPHSIFKMTMLQDSSEEKCLSYYTDMLEMACTLKRISDSTDSNAITAVEELEKKKAELLAQTQQV